jgi:hypothetical protein
MNEEAVKYAFDLFVRDGYKGDLEKFQKLLATNQEALDYSFTLFERDGYKGGKDKYKGLMGLGEVTAPVATAEPEKTEQTTIEPAKTEPAKTEPAKTEPTTPIATPPVATETVATTEPATTAPVAETKPTVTPEPAKIEVKSVEPTPTKEEPMTAEKKEAVKSDIESQLLPVTEKTEVKAIETPSDKMVIKSEQPKVEVKPTEVAKMEVKEMKTQEPKMKVKGKLKTEPIKIETIKVESEKGPTTIDVPSFAVPEPRKKYKPYGEKGPDVYYSEEYDQYIIKEGDNRTVVEKGSGKYEEIDKKIGEAVKSVKEGEGKCDPEEGGSCSVNNLALTNYLYYNKDESVNGFRTAYEASLIEELDNRKKTFENRGESLWRIYNDKYEDSNSKTDGNLLYGGEEPPKSDRFITYKPFGNDKSLIYDKESGIIFKQLDDKAPMVDLSVTGQVVDEKGNVVKKGSDPREYWQKYAKENPNEGLNVWQGYELDHPEYKELKSIIEGINYKKEKGSKNTFVAPTISTGIPVTEWSQVKEVPAVSDKMVIKSDAKVEPKPVEEVKGVPSYDDLGINTEKDPGDFLGANFDKNTKFEKMSPSELIEKDVLKGRGSRIKLERNKSLRYPDPPGTVFKKEKVGERELYSSYDETNNKWYIYDENSSKDNWTEVKKGPIETLLFSKFFEGGNAYLNEKGRPIQSKEDYNSEEETEKMRKIREGILLNKYLPYVMKNYDNLSNEQKEKLKKDLGVYDDLLPKYIQYSDPNLDFWMNVNNKIFNNPTTTQKGEIEGGLSELYGTDEGNVQYIKSKYDDVIIDSSKLNSDIKGGDIKVLKSFAGDVLYDEKKDIFYYDANKKDINESKESLRLKIIPKGTFIYDKIKSSLSKYNK